MKSRVVRASKALLKRGTVWKKTAQIHANWTTARRSSPSCHRPPLSPSALPTVGPEQSERQATSRCSPAVVVAGNDAFLVIRQSGSNSLPSRCDETRQRGKMKPQVGDCYCRPARLLSSIAFLRLSVFFTDGPAQVLSERKTKKRTMEETNRIDHKVVAVVANSLPQVKHGCYCRANFFFSSARDSTQKGNSPFGEFRSVHSSFRQSARSLTQTPSSRMKHTNARVTPRRSTLSLVSITKTIPRPH